MSTVTEITGLGSYREAFNKLQQRTSPRQPEWLRSLRQEAFDLFFDTGFPTTKDEAWRFTNVTALSREQFSLPEAGGIQLTTEDLQPFILPGAACRLVFVNGHFVPELSDTGPVHPELKPAAWRPKSTVMRQLLKRTWAVISISRATRSVV